MRTVFIVLCFITINLINQFHRSYSYLIFYNSKNFQYHLRSNYFKHHYQQSTPRLQRILQEKKKENESDLTNSDSISQIKEKQLQKLKEKVGSVLETTLNQLQQSMPSSSTRLLPERSHQPQLTPLPSPPSSSPSSSSFLPPQSLNTKVVVDAPVTSQGSNKVSRELEELGYSIEEINLLKDSVKNRLIEMQLQRPSQIPSLWLKNKSPSPSLLTTASSSSFPSSSQNQRNQENNHRSDKRVTTSSPPSLERRKVRWVNPPRPSSQYQEEKLQDVEIVSSEENVEKDSGLEIWPSREEFKEMLLQESKLRVKSIGGWIAPLVRNENKWRFSIYDSWLKFLNEGFGDQIDILENEYTAQLIDEEKEENEKRLQQQQQRVIEISETKPSTNRLVPAGAGTDNPVPRPKPTTKRVISRKEEYDEFIKQQQAKIDSFLSKEEEEEDKISQIFSKKKEITNKKKKNLSEEIDQEEDVETLFNRDNLFGDDEEAKDDDGDEGDEDSFRYQRATSVKQQPRRIKTPVSKSSPITNKYASYESDEV